MSRLAAAYRGYEYQDLLVACRLVDVFLDSIQTVHVDEKLTTPRDTFDDLTIVDKSRHRERVQIKHTNRSNQALPLSTFTRDRRLLRLDHVISTALADRGGPGRDAAELCFRIVLRDAPPTDSKLQEVLVPTDRDPGPFVEGMDSVRMAFRSEALWKQSKARETAGPNGNDFGFLREAVSRTDLAWVCEHLVVEVSAPAASFDLTNPGEAEQLLLRRVRDEVGAGTYPNEHRADVDVAAALVGCARAARSGLMIATKTELLRSACQKTRESLILRGFAADRVV